MQPTMVSLNCYNLHITCSCLCVCVYPLNFLDQIMSTVQGPETVGRHESPSHQPDTLNAFDTSLCSAMNPGIIDPVVLKTLLGFGKNYLYVASNHLPLQTLPATDDFKASSELRRWNQHIHSAGS